METVEEEKKDKKTLRKEKRRRDHINELLLEIKKIEKSLSRDEETRDFILRGGSSDSDYSKITITKINKCKTEREQRLSEIDDEILSTKRGDLDDELDRDTIKNTKIFIEKEEAKAKKKEDEKIVPPKRVWERNMEKDINYHYRYYSKFSGWVPPHIVKNLKDMPNNKGYIWRNIWFFGDLEVEKNQPMIMFEKVEKTDIMRIHEFSTSEHKIYEKKGKNKKVLIKTVRRVNHKKKRM